MCIESVKKNALKECFNHPFQNESKLAQNEVVGWVLEYRDQQYKDNKLVKLSIEAGMISDTDDSSKSVYLDTTDPYYLPTEAELFKVLN